MKSQLALPVGHLAFRFALLWISSAGGFLVAPTKPALALTVTNEPTAHAIDIDGRFSGGVGADGTIHGEWSDVTAVGFISPVAVGEPLRYGLADSPGVNCLFTAARRAREAPPYHLYTYFVFALRTEPDFVRDEKYGAIHVPFTVNGSKYENFAVLLMGDASNRISFFYDLTGDGQQDGFLEDLGVEAAEDFGISPLSPLDHMMVEIKWPLLQQDAVARGGDTGVDPGEDTPMVSEYSDDEDIPRTGTEVIIGNQPTGDLLDIEPQGESIVTVFRRGYCNDDANVDISDASYLLNWLFIGGEEPACLEAANTNGDGAVDLSDAVYLLSFLFLGGESPPEPFSKCGGGSSAPLGCKTPTPDC